MSVKIFLSTRWLKNNMKFHLIELWLLFVIPLCNFIPFIILPFKAVRHCKIDWEGKLNLVKIKFCKTLSDEKLNVAIRVNRENDHKERFATIHRLCSFPAHSNLKSVAAFTVRVRVDDFYYVWLNPLAFPAGRIILYISRILSLPSWPSGQSCLNPLQHIAVRYPSISN